MRQILLLPAFFAAALGLAGCGSSSSTTTTTTTTTPTAPAATLSSTQLNFAGTLAGTTTAAQTVTLTNSGTAALAISGITLGGTNTSNFTLTNGCSGSLAIGANCTFSVTFSPTASPTSYSATVSVVTNAATATQTVALAGTSLTPGATLSTTGLTFAGTAPGANSPAQTVTLTSSGTAPLTIGSVTVGGTNGSNFTLTNGCSGTLATGASCSFSVTFAPGASATAGTVDIGAINIITNAPTSPQAVNLIGTTTASAAPTAILSSTSLTFPATASGATSPSQTVTLFNTGTAALTIGSLTLGGSNASNFTLTSGCANTLAAGASCPISVTFSPGSAIATIAYSAAITLVTNATPATQTISLSSSSSVSSQCAATVPRKANPSTTSNYAGSTFTGKVLAGTTPMIGASVQLYAAGSAGNGSTPMAIGSSTVTDANGAFSITKSYTCPFNLSTLYLVSTGGKPGATGTANSGAVLLSVLGTCASVTTGTSYVVDEATTVAGAYALAQFLVPGGKAGASSTNFLGLQLAAASAANLVNPLTGTSPGATFPASATPPSALINTLADVLNACVVGGSSTTACTQLYASVGNSVSALPTNTLDAVLSLALNPAAGKSLYTLSQTSTAYTPGLTAAPTDWTMYITYTGGGMNGPSGVGVDSTGNVWVASYFNAASYFTNTGKAVFPTGITGNYLQESYGLAVDQSDNAWIPDEQGPYGINSGIGSVTVLNTAGSSAAGATGYSAGGINFPVADAIDTGGTTWVVDYGNSHVTLLNPSGTPISGTSGYASNLFDFPVAVAVDANCYGYIANQSSNTITRVAQDGSSFTNFVVGSGASGVAVDAGNNVWSANYYGNSVGLLAANGTVVSSSLSGGGINHPQGVAIDGNGNVWLTNYRGPALTELSAATSTSPGAALSPSVGYGPDANLLEAFGLAIDPSGNIWVTNFGNNTLTEFIGIAAPVKTPRFGPVVQP